MKCLKTLKLHFKKFLDKKEDENYLDLYELYNKENIVASDIKLIDNITFQKIECTDAEGELGLEHINIIRLTAIEKEEWGCIEYRYTSARHYDATDIKCRHFSRFSKKAQQSLAFFLTFFLTIKEFGDCNDLYNFIIKELSV